MISARKTEGNVLWEYGELIPGELEISPEVNWSGSSIEIFSPGYRLE